MTFQREAMMPLRALMVWCVLLLAAVANGGIREAVLVPRVGAATGHVLSSISLATIILVVTTATITWIGPANAAEARTIGIAWLLMTVAFEFGFGLARGVTLQALLADYNILRGRIWLLVLVSTCLAPSLAARWRGLFGD